MTRRPLRYNTALLTPTEVSALFGVHPRTVVLWEKKGTIAAMRTPGGHRRFRRADVQALYEASGGVWPV